MSIISTSINDMKKLKSGDSFWINGEMHRAIGNAHMSGDSTCEEYIVYDENGEGWFETDFQRTNTNRIVPLFDRKRHRKSFVCFLAGICCYFAGMRRRG